MYGPTVQKASGAGTDYQIYKHKAGGSMCTEYMMVSCQTMPTTNTSFGHW